MKFLKLLKITQQILRGPIRRPPENYSQNTPRDSTILQNLINTYPRSKFGVFFDKTKYGPKRGDGLRPSPLLGPYFINIYSEITPGVLFDILLKDFAVPGSIC